MICYDIIIFEWVYGLVFTFYGLENKKFVGYNIKADISLKNVIRRKSKNG